VSPRPGQTIDKSDLRAYLAARFPKWWVPDEFVFLDAIPRTSVGKFAKGELRARFEGYHWP
jgi:fatty-acyl-CoA synthase